MSDPLALDEQEQKLIDYLVIKLRVDTANVDFAGLSMSSVYDFAAADELRWGHGLLMHVLRRLESRRLVRTEKVNSILLIRVSGLAAGLASDRAQAIARLR